MQGKGHGRSTWSEESSPTDIPYGIDPSSGGVLVLIHNHMALGVHPHALPWQTAATYAPGGMGTAHGAPVTGSGDPRELQIPVGRPETRGHPPTSTEGTRCHLTTRSRHSPSELGSRPTAHSRQSTSRITSSVGLWPGTTEATVTSSSPREDLVTFLT